MTNAITSSNGAARRSTSSARSIGRPSRRCRTPSGCCASPAASSAIAPSSRAAWRTNFWLAADEGKLSRDECPALIVDYIAPSIDTTMSAISNALYLFATHPEQWQLLKDEPELMANAINEVVRFEPPLRAFARSVGQADRDCRCHHSRGRPGTRDLRLGNRDEREWDEPAVFDIRRDAGRQIGFGQGAHACAGQGLARLETTALLHQAGRTRGPHRADRPADVGDQQHHPPPRAATAEVDSRLDGRNFAGVEAVRQVGADARVGVGEDLRRGGPAVAVHRGLITRAVRHQVSGICGGRGRGRQGGGADQEGKRRRVFPRIEPYSA